MSQSIDYFFYSYFRIQPDPRTKDWFPVTDFKLTVSVVVIYLLVCLGLGPMVMKNRQPMQLTKVLTCYNLTMILVSAYISYESFMGGWGTTYKLMCQPVGAADDKSTYRMTNAHYVYFVSKFIELLDTVFFMLRKKDSQITFLHVYHHGIVVIMSYCSLRYLPDGHGTLIVLLNSLIHVIMYSYYFMAALGPKMQKYLWWKKYLTTMQLVQFVMTAVHALAIFHPSCDYPRPLVTVLIANVAFFLLLFANFYRKSYSSNKAKHLENNIATDKSQNHTAKKTK